MTVVGAAHGQMGPSRPVARRQGPGAPALGQGKGVVMNGPSLLAVSDLHVANAANREIVVAPLFLLYDYTFDPHGASTTEEGLAMAYDAGVVCADEVLLDPDPYPSRAASCRARVEETEQRLLRLDPTLPTVLVNHLALARDSTRWLRYPEFAQSCGTEATADWHKRVRAIAVVHGHLHVPHTTTYDAVRFEEASFGHPQEWRRRGGDPDFPRRVLPLDGDVCAVATTASP